MIGERKSYRSIALSHKEDRVVALVVVIKPTSDNSRDVPRNAENRISTHPSGNTR
jgi:hypothetical protein